MKSYYERHKTARGIRSEKFIEQYDLFVIGRDADKIKKPFFL
jgi:hypothetical protein